MAMALHQHHLDLEAFLADIGFDLETPPPQQPQ